MKGLAFFVSILLVSTVGLMAQTRFYLALPDGTCDSSSYREIVNGSGKVIVHDETTSFRSDTVRNVRLRFEENKIHMEVKVAPKAGKQQEIVDVIIGWVNEKKEILDTSVQINGVASTSAYIRYSKVFDIEQKLVGYISGNELYGAGLYLLRP
jgi:hypothetical protein